MQAKAPVRGNKGTTVRIDLPIQKICNEYLNGMSTLQLGNKYDCSDGTIRNRLIENSVERRPANDRLELPTQQICDEYRSGTSIFQLATKYSCTAKPIRLRLAESSVEVRPACRGRYYPIDTTYFDCIDTEEKAYWVGFILADGNISPSKSRAPQIRIEISSRDAQHMEKFTKSTSAERPILLSCRSGRCCARIAIRSYEWGEALAKHNIVPNKGIIGFATPKLADKLYGPFYRGFFDGDGGLSFQASKHTWRTYCIGPRGFIQDFAYWLSNKADVSSKRVYRMKPKSESSPDTWGWRYDGNHQVPRIVGALYNGATIYLDRKYIQYQAMLQMLGLMGVGGG